MGATKLSISLPETLTGFVEGYRKRRGLKTRSEVFEEALRLLQERELEAAYREAAAEYDESWDTVASDGLADETW